MTKTMREKLCLAVERQLGEVAAAQYGSGIGTQSAEFAAACVEAHGDLVDTILAELMEPGIEELHAIRSIADQYTTPLHVYLRTFTAMIDHMRKGG